MLGKQIREAVEGVRSDADKHMDRIAESVSIGTDVLTLTLAAVAVMAGAALLIAVWAAVDG